MVPLLAGAVSIQSGTDFDTTIASFLSQEVDVMKVVKSRLKYAVIAGGAASVGYIVFGFMSSGSGVADKLLQMQPMLPA